MERGFVANLVIVGKRKKWVCWFWFEREVEKVWWQWEGRWIPGASRSRWRRATGVNGEGGVKELWRNQDEEGRWCLCGGRRRKGRVNDFR